MSDAKKSVLVTGASAGIGAATCDQLLRDGWTVYASARRTDRLQPLVERGAHALSLDVTDDRSMREAVQFIRAREPQLDALVNNAGYGSYGAVEDVPLDEARRQFEVNVFGLARLCQLVLPAMREAGSGRIVNVSSIGGRIFTPMGGWYHATKHAVEGLSDALRVEAKPFGIDVIVVQPGAIETEWTGISVETLNRASGHGAYREMADLMARVLREGGDPRRAVPPSVIGKVISRALHARRPRARYAAPLDAKIFLAMRRLLPDRAFDWFLMKVLRHYGGAARTPAQG